MTTPSKAANLDEAVERLREIISDDEIVRVHGNARFGSLSPRDVVADGVRKYAVGFEGGYTKLCILLEHGLITKPRPGSSKASLTEKGKRYARVLHGIDRDALSASNARAEAAEEALREIIRDAAPWANDESLVADALIDRARTTLASMTEKG